MALMITEASSTGFGAFTVEPGATGSIQGRPQGRLTDVGAFFGAVVLCAGSGGFTRQILQLSGPSSTHVLIDSRAIPKQESAIELDVIAISAADRVRVIQQQLSMNVKQIAAVSRVGRPAVYDWINGLAAPRKAQQERLKELYDVARAWKAMSREPIGRSLIAPIQGKLSLLGLLKAGRLDRAAIDEMLGTIKNAQVAQRKRTEASGYRSAASLIKSRNLTTQARASQRGQIENTVDLL